MASKIRFDCHDIRFKLTRIAETRAWLEDIIKTEGFISRSVNFVFTSDEHLLSVNQSFLQHDTFTDIITFDNSDSPGQVEADIFISIPRVRENATKYGESFERELRRVLAHGILHLVGYKDKSPSDKALMREKEDRYLSLLDF